MKSLDKLILQIVETKQPQKVKELIQLVQEQSGANLEDIEKEIRSLQEKGLIKLEEAIAATPKKFSNVLVSRKNAWFWTIISLALLTFVSILLIPETGTPLSYLRYVFSFVFVVFLPGYCLTEALFPKKQALDEIERVTFSVGLSFAVTAIVGLFLSFTPFGLTLTTTLLTLGFIVIALALVALKRKYKTENNKRIC